MKQKQNFFIRMLVLLGMLAAFLSPIQTARAATCTSQANGDWDAITWSCGTPVSGDDFVIAHNVTANVAVDAGSLNINSGAILTGTVGVSFEVAGNWSDSGTFVPGGGTVTFDGSNTQTIAKSGGESFYKLLVNKTSGDLILGDNVTLSGNSGDVLTLQGGVDLNGKTMELDGIGNYYIRAIGGTRTITGTVGSRLLLYSETITTTVTVTSTSSGSLVFGSDTTLELSGETNRLTQFDPGSSLTTINGNLKISWGGQVIKNGPTYGDSSTLIYSYAYSTSSADYNINTEWPAGTSGSSIPMNVQLSSAYPNDYSTTIALASNSHRTLRGNMTFGKNTALRLPQNCSPKPTPPGYCGVDLFGNWYNNGGLIYGIGSRTIGFKGTSEQLIGGSSPTTFPTLRIQNSNKVVLGILTEVDTSLAMASGNLDLMGFTLSLASTATITPSVRTAFTDTKMIVADNATLCKSFSGTTNPVNFLYPIGDDTATVEYSPAEVDLIEGDPYIDFTVCVRVLDEKHPNLNKTSYFTRYWRITNSQGEPVGSPFDGLFYYRDADVWAVSPIEEKDFYSARYTSGTWTVYSNPVITTTNYFMVNSVIMVNEADYTPYPIDPTAVTMVNTKATPERGQVRLEWTTAQETGLLGFEVYRSTRSDGSGRIPISGFIPSESGSGIGTDYEYLDINAEVGVPYYYWIETLGSSGSEFFGPLEAILLNQIYLPILRR